MRDEDLVLIPRRVIGAACGALGRSDKKDCAALVDLRSYAFHPAATPTPTPATGSGGDAKPIGWVKTDNDRCVIDFANRDSIAAEWQKQPRLIVQPVYTHPAPAGGDAGGG